MKKRQLIYLIAFLIINVSHTQSVFAQGKWTLINTTNSGSNGLVSNYIKDMAKDSSENIWLSTDRAVSMYNGEEWITHYPFDSIAGSFGANHIAVDNNNHIWASHSTKGLSKYDGTTWTVFNTGNGLSSNAIGDICHADSLMWFGTGNGLIKYDGNEFANVHFGDTTMQLIWNPQTSQYDTTIVYNDYNILAMGYDHYKNKLWVSGYDYASGNISAKLKMFDGITWTNFTTNDGVIDTMLSSISVDTAGNVWLGSMDLGVSKYDYSTFTNFTRLDGLISDSIRSIACDSNGVVWFGTYVGVSKFEGNTWTSFNIDDGLVNNIINIIDIKNDNEIWIGTGTGISVYNGQEFSEISTKDGLIDNWVNDIDDSENGIWIDTDRGASFFDGKTWTGYNSSDGLAGRSIEAALDDISGRIWFGSVNAGMTILDGENVTVMEENRYRNVKDILKDNNGNIWVGGSALSKYNGSSWTNISIDGVAPHGILNSLALDSNYNIWAGFTLGAIGKYDGSSWTSYSLSIGGANSYVNSIVVDSNGVIWSHGKGLFRFDGNIWIEIDSAYGFLHNTVHGLAIDMKNMLWITTPEGLTSYDGSVYTDYPAPNDFYLGQIEADHYNNKWMRMDAYGVARYCETMYINGNVTRESISVTGGLAYLYSFTDNGLELVNEVEIDANGNYSIPVDYTGEYVVSAIADTSSSSTYVETFFNQITDPCNNYGILVLRCADSLQNIDIELYEESDILTADYYYTQLNDSMLSFTNTSLGNYNESHWAFGDGNTSNETNPVHIYTNNGVYVVVQTIRDSMSVASCFDFHIDTLEVMVILPPMTCNAGFVIYPDTTQGIITVVNSSTGENLEYLWDFGDGNTSSEPYPFHTYETADSFNLCLSIDDGNGCADTYCDSIGLNGVIFRQEGFSISVIPPVPTEIDELNDLNPEIIVFPNPVTGYLSVVSELIIEKINIIALNGRVYNTFTSDFHKINIEDLPSGIYILNCISGSETINKRILKQ